MKRLLGGRCKEERHQAGGGPRAAVSRRPAQRAGCAHARAQRYTHAQPQGGRPRLGESKRSGGAIRGRVSKDADVTGRLNHSSLVSGMLLAGSSTLQVLKSLWPPPRSLPSLGSQLLGLLPGIQLLSRHPEGGRGTKD